MALAIQKLGAAGVTLIDVELPPNFAGLVQAQLDIMTWDMARSFAHEWHAHRDQLSQRLQDLIAAGLALPRERFDAAVTLTTDARRATSDLFSNVDVLLTPSAAGEAPVGLEANRRSHFQPDLDPAAHTVRAAAICAGPQGPAGGLASGRRDWLGPANLALCGLCAAQARLISKCGEQLPQLEQ